LPTARGMQVAAFAVRRGPPIALVSARRPGRRGASTTLRPPPRGRVRRQATFVSVVMTRPPITVPVTEAAPVPVALGASGQREHGECRPCEQPRRPTSPSSRCESRARSMSSARRWRVLTVSKRDGVSRGDLGELESLEEAEQQRRAIRIVRARAPRRRPDGGSPSARRDRRVLGGVAARCRRREDVLPHQRRDARRSRGSGRRAAATRGALPTRGAASSVRSPPHPARCRRPSRGPRSRCAPAPGATRRPRGGARRREVELSAVPSTATKTMRRALRVQGPSGPSSETG
jgi:hypothetical protein